MTLQEELKRTIEDRDMMECDADLLNEEIRQMEIRGVNEDDEEYNALERELNSMQNEAMYLDSVIEDLEYRIAENMS